jgi:2-oxoglutarate ferredoxin oxidoreductase subunit beta
VRLLAGGLAVLAPGIITFVSIALNRLGLPREAYKGAATTLCAGCGHNSITNHLIKALYELGIPPARLAKMSGIGCSSKTPAYFVESAHGFNGVHGRMPSLATGAALANRDLIMLGVSGDGDTASIGLGQFAHLIRRNVDCTYIIEDNGTYGLTKGQFSATADLGSVQKKGSVNTFHPIDPCALALTLGCSFVARSFSGDGKQLVPLLKAALSHRGTAVIDVLSPCVTFNDHEGSTKSYVYIKDHGEVLAEDISYIPAYNQEILADYDPGTTCDVTLPDGSHLILQKLREDYDPSSRSAAYRAIEESSAAGRLLTGLLYIDPSSTDFTTTEHLPTRPLASLTEEELRPTREQFAQIMAEFA